MALARFLFQLHPRCLWKSPSTSTTTPPLQSLWKTLSHDGLSTKPLHQEHPSVSRFQRYNCCIMVMLVGWRLNWGHRTPISVANIRFTFQPKRNFGWFCSPYLGSARLLLYKNGHATALTLILLMLFITPISDRPYRTITCWNYMHICGWISKNSHRKDWVL